MIRTFRHWLSSLKTRRILYRTVLLAGDVALVSLCQPLAYLTRFYWDPFVAIFPITKGLPPVELYWPLQWMAVGVWLAAFIANGFYERVNLPTLDEILRVARGVVLGWVILLAGTFLYRGTEFSRLVMLLSACYTFVAVLLFREIVKWLYAHLAVNWWEPHTVLIMGSGRMSKSIQRVLGDHPELSLVHKSTRDPKELEKYLRDHAIREVFVGEPDLDHTTLIAMSEVCDEFQVPFRIVPDVLELRMGEVIIDNSLGLPTYQIKPITLHGWTYFYKRMFDISVSILILSLGMPLFLLIALLIRIDSNGPILLRQSRMGYRKKSFPFFKFRTMVENADTLLEELKKLNDRGGPVFKMKNDPRITRVGKWLRKYSLDEIPQIINVLRGEMSLVGPRPQVLWEAAAYDDLARKRLNVLPGITGLWQVSGRAHLTYEEMIELDIYYIEHWSPGLDFKILLRTLPTILGGQGAY
jgi:exopolysaccharide biosynthesis polyprenyl glycosylphosphotransferase